MPFAHDAGRHSWQWYHAVLGVVVIALLLAMIQSYGCGDGTPRRGLIGRGWARMRVRRAVGRPGPW